MFSHGEKSSFIWGALSLVFMMALIFILALTAVDVGDIVYAMLSGSFVGLLTATYALAKGVPPGRSVFLIFAGIVGSALAWILSMLLLKITTLILYSETALAFDLIIGMIGSSSLCFFILSQYANGAGMLHCEP